MLPLFVIMLGAFLVLGMLVFAFTGPSTQRAGDRRIAALRERHGPEDVIASAHMRRIAAVQATKMDLAFGKLLPNRAMLAKRLAMTGRGWTVSQYGMASAALTLVTAALLLIKGAPVLLALFMAVLVGLGLPHKVVGIFIAKPLDVEKLLSLVRVWMPK